MGILTRVLPAPERRLTLSQAVTVLANQLGATSAAGVEVSPDTAIRYMAVFACVRVLAEDVASLPLITYQRLARGRARAPAHPLFDLLHNQPNPEMTSFTWREVSMWHLGLWGNSYHNIVFNEGGGIHSLWPLNPRRVEVKRNLAGDLEYIVELPKAVAGDFRGGKTTLPASEVLHIPGYSLNGITGLSPIGLAREAIGLGKATEEFGARFFGSGARPGLVLQHKKTLSDPAYRRLKREWEQKHQGLANAHRVAILEEGMDLKEVGIPPTDAQFIETRKFQVREIARLYRMQPHKIGDLEDATFSNIEMQAIEHVVDTVRPWLVRWEQALMMKLMPPPQRQVFFLEFLVDALLRGETKTRMDSYAVARQWGWMSADDVREKENMNPLPDGQGEIYMVPLNMVPASQIAEDGAGAKETASAAEVRAATARRKLGQAFRPVFEDATRRIVRRETQQVLRAAKAMLPPARTAAMIGKSTDRSMGEFELWVADFYTEHEGYVRRQLAPAYGSYAEAIAGEATTEVNGRTARQAATPEMDAFVADYTTSAVARYVDSSKGQVLSLAGDATRAGEEAVPALEKRFGEWEATRPGKLAARETVQAGSAVTLFVFGQHGVQRKAWAAHGKNCPYCTDLDGKTVELQGQFLSPGKFQPEGAERPLTVTTSLGHPPAHGGCDCSVVAS